MVLLLQLVDPNCNFIAPSHSAQQHTFILRVILLFWNKLADKVASLEGPNAHEIAEDGERLHLSVSAKLF